VRHTDVDLLSELKQVPLGHVMQEAESNIVLRAEFICSGENALVIPCG
jgi:hypothetical protein